MVEHDVEAKHFEAHVVCEVLGVDGGDGGAESGVAGDDGLDNNVVDVLLEQLDVLALAGDMLEDGSQRPLVPHVHVLHALVEYEFGAVLIDGVVGQVHKLVLQVLAPRRAVLLCRKSGQPLLVHKYAEWVNSRDEHVDAHVEFEALD